MTETEAILFINMTTMSVCENAVFSWGRGDRGVLGHDDTASSSTPRIIRFFDSKRVSKLSAGFQHVLVLTEDDGVFAFGDGSHGKLGTGTGCECGGLV